MIKTLLSKKFTVVIVLLTGLSGAGCSTNPATGKSQLNFIGTDREIALGSTASPKFLANYGGEIESKAVWDYVSDLGHRLAKVSERPDLPWEFQVVDSSVINAFALPGGKVFVTRGLISKLENEAQLAGVLGHEVGHVTAQHIGQQMSRGMVLQGLATAIGIGAQNSNKEWLKVLGTGTQVGGTVYLLKFGRDQESEADKLGVRYMSRLGYNPTAQLDVMRILEQAAAGKKRQPEFLSTHPLPQTRINRLEKHIHEDYPDYSNPNTYQLHADRFQLLVLDPIKRLLPASHPASQPPASSTKHDG